MEDKATHVDDMEALPRLRNRGESVGTYTRPDDGHERMSGAASETGEGGSAGSPTGRPSEDEALEQLDGMVAFLSGSEAYDGVWFGEMSPRSGAGDFWWRSAILRPVAEILRKALADRLRNSGGPVDLVLGIFKDFSVTEGGDCNCGDQWRLGQCAECRHRQGAVEAIFDLLAAPEHTEPE